MRHFLAGIMAIWLAANIPSAAAGDHLDGVVPLARDDIAAVAQLRSQPDRHVMLYFGDHVN
jgi:hypothetical protein